MGPPGEDHCVFQIKICGVTRPSDARHAAEAGADAVGLNFYSQSPRYIELATAQAVVAKLPEGVVKVGVFVNEEVSRIVEVADAVPLDFIQLHGDETPEIIFRLKPRQVIRAFRLGKSLWEPVVEFLAKCRKLNSLPAALLIDAHAGGLYGGTGQTADWAAVRDRPPELANYPLILAGGLTPENVAQAIATARPFGVDTASGVESSAGVKDRDKVQRFVGQARAALKI